MMDTPDPLLGYAYIAQESESLPKVSVIIPTYNHGKFVAQAIESVLAQDFQDYEIIVVDDGSTDNTQDVLAGYTGKIIGVRQENKGLAASRNHGIRLSKGKYLVFLDADDLLEPGKLSAQVEALDTHPTWGVAYSGWKYIDQTGTHTLAISHPKKAGNLLEEWLLRQFFFPVGAAMVRRVCFDVVGVFESSMRAAEDTDFWFRVAQAGFMFGFTEDIVYDYRITPGSLSHNTGHQMRHEFMRLDRVYANPDVSPRLLELKEKAYAILSIEAASRYFHAGEKEKAQEMMRQAAKLHPEIATDQAWLIEWLTGAALDPRVEDPEGYIRSVISLAPQEYSLLKASLRKAIAKFHAASVFSAANVRDFAKVRKHILPAITGDTSILTNKGFIITVIRGLFTR